MSVFFTTQNTNSVQVQQENACSKIDSEDLAGD